MKKAIKTLMFSVFFFSYLGLPLLLAQQGLPFINPGQSISMDFQDANLKDVLKIFSMQSGLSFIASDNVKDKKITLYLDRVNIKDAMNKLFLANNLEYNLESDSNILIVKDLGKTEVERVTRVYYLKYHSVPSSSIVKENKNRDDVSAAATTGSGSATSIISTIKGVLSKDGLISEDSRTNSLIITDIPSVFSEVEKIISYLDISQPQVMLEVEMLDVSKGTTDKLGINWSNAGSYSVNINSASQTTAFPYGSLFASKLGDITNTLTNGSITFPTSLSVVLDFLSTQSDTKYLARPKILTLNNEVAEIKIITKEVVGEKRNIESASSGNSNTTYEAERFETGVSLRVTPQVNIDTNEITMFIVPSVSEATQSAIKSSSVLNQYYYNPEVRTTKSLIRVKDGETIIVGGLIKNKATTTTTKLPVLGDIPLLGMLFRHKNVDPGQERELLVFITPRIMKDKKTNPIREKRASMFKREQGAYSLSDRDMNIEIALNNLDRNRK
ncbi:MAG: secretin N-terminal domain-containing protein [Candidatus Omnitrophota bacterium]